MMKGSEGQEQKAYQWKEKAEKSSLMELESDTEL